VLRKLLWCVPCTLFNRIGWRIESGSSPGSADQTPHPAGGPSSLAAFPVE
jgi:hypothetical protein